MKRENKAKKSWDAEELLTSAEGGGISRFEIALAVVCFLCVAFWAGAAGACATFWRRVSKHCDRLPFRFAPFSTKDKIQPSKPQLRGVQGPLYIPQKSMNNRIKLKTPAITNRIEMEGLIRDIAGLKFNEQLLNSGMDAEIQAVRDKYRSRLNTVAEVLTEKVNTARAWAEANPEEFGRRKSIDFPDGSVGFRTGMPKLKMLAKWKWDDVLRALQAARWGGAYIRVKEEINKEQIIADIGAEVLSAADLRKAGAQVVREESFYVDTKLTRVESRAVAEVA